jgi:anti-sigma B factor antagonist
MLIRTRSQDAITTVDLHGRLGVEDGGALHEAVRDLLNAGRREVVLNLLGVTGVDAAGLGELAGAFSMVRTHGAELRLVLRCESVRELLIRTNLLGLLPTFPTEVEAIASFETSLPA